MKTFECIECGTFAEKIFCYDLEHKYCDDCYTPEMYEKQYLSKEKDILMSETI